MLWLRRAFRLPELWLLAAAALLTRLWQLGQPPAIVFDEVYFRAFAGNYLSGQYFFDIHPPLIKLILAGTASVFGIRPEQLTVDDPAGAALRIVPALAGAALVPLIYVIIRQFGLGRRIALLGGLLILLDNALMVESRFVLMDSMLLLAGFGALSCYLALRKAVGWKRWLWVLPMALFMGVTISSKWSGLAIVGLIGLAWLIETIVYRRREWLRFTGEAATVFLIMLAVYIGSFAVHFSLLTKSGEGDAFMSQKFQSTLQGNSLYDPSVRMALWDKIVELNIQMYTAQNTLQGVEHPYASRWYSWPLQIRPVYFWQGDVSQSGVQPHVYLLGNPFVWWGSTLGVLVALILWLAKPRLLGRHRRLVAFLLVGYGVNFVPFAFIDRPMFLYHYLFALIFALLATCVLIARLFDWQRHKYGKKAVEQTYWALIFAILLCFLYFLPISYGWPVSASDLQQRMWLPTWR